ncbi:MAG: hypothetical protein HDT40_09455 [Lachnospiraceae bacterium]|nr:hypothetical protein [Lachnospiraceae bacterium]
MMGRDTAFKKVYGEVLAPYGYKKVKGGKPYLVRVVSDEIIHVVSCVNCDAASYGMGEYMICGGVVTVYRKEINFSCPASFNHWLLDNLQICQRTTDMEYSPSLCNEFIAKYEKDNEESLLTSMWNTVEKTKQYLLPVLEKVTDLRSCIDYYHKFAFADILCYFADGFEVGTMGGRASDWLSFIKLFTFEEFKKMKQSIYNSDMEKYKEKIKSNILLNSDKSDIEWLTTTLNRELTGFEKWTKDPLLYKKLLDEMEIRKAGNIEKLRCYGLEI